MQRTFLITGASKGIGLALSQRLAAQGHRVIGIARNQADGFPGALHTLDLGATEASRRLAQIVDTHPVDGVVNNVGLVRAEPLGAIEAATLDEVLRTNLHPALAAVQAALPTMKVRGCPKARGPCRHQAKLGRVREHGPRRAAAGARYHPGGHLRRRARNRGRGDRAPSFRARLQRHAGDRCHD